VLLLRAPRAQARPGAPAARAGARRARRPVRTAALQDLIQLGLVQQLRVLGLDALLRAVAGENAFEGGGHKVVQARPPTRAPSHQLDCDLLGGLDVGACAEGGGGHAVSGAGDERDGRGLAGAARATATHRDRYRRRSRHLGVVTVWGGVGRGLYGASARACPRTRETHQSCAPGGSALRSVCPAPCRRGGAAAADHLGKTGWQPDRCRGLFGLRPTAFRGTFLPRYTPPRILGSPCRAQENLTVGACQSRVVRFAQAVRKEKGAHSAQAMAALAGTPLCGARVQRCAPPRTGPFVYTEWIRMSTVTPKLALLVVLAHFGGRGPYVTDGWW
jgi:hypothetical protein